LILIEHEPYPAVVIDRGWNFIAANQSMLTLTAGVDVDPALLEPPINILRLGLHPRGLAPLMVNLGEWRAHFRERIERQAALTGDADLAALGDEIAGYPVHEQDADAGCGASEVLGPLKIRAPDGGVLAFLGMFATFDTLFEVTSSELAIELLFPADQATADMLSPKSRADDGT
jgi:hypothetical protein